MFEGIFGKKSDRLIEAAKTAINEFRKFSLEHPAINTGYSNETYTAQLADLDKIKSVIDKGLPFDEGKKSPKKRLQEENEKNYSQNGFLEEIIYAKITDEKLRNKLEQHYKSMQTAIINLSNYIKEEYKPNLSPSKY